MLTEMTKDEEKIEKTRRIHYLIQECMDMNGIKAEDSIPAIFYHLLIVSIFNKVSRKEFSKGLNMIKKQHSEYMEERGL